jgi:hypothetical protein
MESKMTNEDLEKIRNKYKELKDKRSEILKIAEDIKRYEQDPIVKKYMELIKLYKKNTTGCMNAFDKKTDDDLLNSALISVRINETNNIYVYMGTFKKRYEYDEEYCEDDYQVKKNDLLADYRTYRNLEFMSYQDDYEVKVPIEYCEEFEEEHIIIYPQGTCGYDQYYLKLRNEFFDTAILESQEKALEKILSLRKKTL